MDAPRDNLIRANFENRAEVDDGRNMVGYPIVFDTWTTINGWEGQFKERIGDKALTKTLRENRDGVRVLYDHGMDPSIGNKPLGKPVRMQPDATGLDTLTPLSRTSYNDDLIELMNDGAIDGMSFRFSVVKDEWVQPKRGLPERTITELRLFEFGPVTFPAYQATTVGIRSRDHFAAWMGLNEENRSQVYALMGIATDLRTLDSEADEEVTSEDGAASETDPEPQVQHSDGTPTIRDEAEAMSQRLRSYIK